MFFLYLFQLHIWRSAAATLKLDSGYYFFYFKLFINVVENMERFREKCPGQCPDMNKLVVGQYYHKENVS